MNEADAAARIEAFVREAFTVDESDARFGRDVDLFEGGYVDSVGLIELLAFIEDEFGLEVPDEDLASAEFTTIDGMAAVLVRLFERAGRS
jgi:acyl carrier protein